MLWQKAFFFKIRNFVNWHSQSRWENTHTHTHKRIFVCLSRLDHQPFSKVEDAKRFCVCVCLYWWGCQQRWRRWWPITEYKLRSKSAQPRISINVKHIFNGNASNSHISNVQQCQPWCLRCLLVKLLLLQFPFIHRSF